MPGDAIHEVEAGEWAARAAWAHGITKWRERVWNLDDNREIKCRRDPFVLAPGDELALPDDGVKCVDAETEKHHRFRIRRKREVIRVRLLKESLDAITKNSKASKSCKYRFRVEGGADVTGEEAIDARGVVTLVVPFCATCVILMFEEDRGDGRAVKHRLLCRLGRLRPMHKDDPACVSLLGVQQRLHALGFSPGPRDGIDGPRTRAAVRAFQLLTADATKRERLGAPEIKNADGQQGEKLWEALRAVYGA